MKLFLIAETRIIFRNTSDYYKALYDSYDPILLNDSRKRIKFFFSLSKSFGSSEKYQNIIKYEVKDLMISDIPYFYTKVNSKYIYSSNGSNLDIKLICSGYHLILFYIKNYITSANTKSYIQLIKNSFYAAQLNSIKDNNSKIYQKLIKRNALKNIKIEKKSIALVKNILNNLLEIKLEDNSNFYWPTIVSDSSGCWNAQLTDQSFYLGSAGIIFVYTWASKILNCNNYHDISDEYLNKLQFQFNNPVYSKEITKIGVFDGLGGTLYLLCHIYLIKKNSKIIPIIKIILKIIESKISNNNTQLNLISGISGLIRILLHIKNVFNDLEITNLLNRCAKRLLNVSFSEISSNKDNSSLGFSHGISGMAWSLMHWSNYSKNYEHTHSRIKKTISNVHKNFFKNNMAIKKASQEDNESIFTWCNGLTGIALAKLDLSREFGSHNWKKTIDTDIDIINKNGFSVPSINLCHGRMGNLELLLEASLYNSKFSKMYYERALQLIEAIDHLKSTPEFLTTPGLMTGATGIAYQLLRVAYPEVVPSVLLLRL